MKINMIYITAKDKDEAKAIGKGLVEERLVACVNIIDNMESIYWWEGRVQEAHEVVLIAKTKESLVPKVIDKVKSMHSYDCPCIVLLPVLGGNPEYLEWVAKETK